jgi:DnaJ-class molecular chaperone
MSPERPDGATFHECEKCHGTGMTESEQEECAECDGTGEWFE